MTAAQDHALRTMGQLPGWRATWQFGDHAVFGPALLALHRAGRVLRRMTPAGPQWLLRS